jgi:DsbC/DsbD-like thiol-disulfide interchange protein
MQSQDRKHLPWAAVLTCLYWSVATSQETVPVGWSLHLIESSPSEKLFVARLKADIMQGWHLYAMEQAAGGPRPLRISLVPAKRYELRSMQAPSPRVAHDANFDAPTRYYETSAVFDLQIARRPGPVEKLSIEVRYQACNAQMCLPPVTIQLETHE